MLVGVAMAVIRTYFSEKSVIFAAGGFGNFFTLSKYSCTGLSSATDGRN
jgi:succinate dehydrogenase/fumarate reductase flavoprotein subunit